MIQPRRPERGFTATIVDELKPRPGRLGASFRTALCCVIVVVLSMSLEVPEAALSCYLVFFASRNNAASGILIAVGLVIAASVGILLGIVVLQFASDDPMLRVALIAAFTFTGMYMSVATSAGSIGATVGFVFAFVLTLEDFVPLPELLSRGLSWMWVVVFFPMAALVVVNMLFGPNPAELARHGLARRLAMAAALLRGEKVPRKEVSRLLSEDIEELSSPVRLGTFLGLATNVEADRLAAAIPASQDILAASVGSPKDPALASQLDRMATTVASRRSLPPGWRPAIVEAGRVPMAQATERLARSLTGPPPERKAAALALAISPIDLSNAEHLHFALKAMLAVFITYGIYTTRDWFEIHTAMITCFYVALGTTGETLHKATLRIVGCLLGAALGVASIVFLMPHMTDIGHLILLVGVCSFIAAWVANGSVLIEYAGWQMALAFFLCVLHGYGPSLDVGVATNRVLGILIGNVVVAIVFLSFWPTSVGAAVSRNLADGMNKLADLIRRPAAGIAEAASSFGEATRLARLSVFEPSWLRKRLPMFKKLPAIVAKSDDILPQMAQMQLLRSGNRYLFGAPYSVKVATKAQEASVAGFLRLAADAMVDPAFRDLSILEQALQKATQSLGRLERLALKAPRRAPWRGDLLDLTYAYRKLLLDFSETLEAM
jgi:multidrug resistance protein MdtO